MKQVTYTVMDYKELEALTTEHIGPGWESVAAGEWSNGQTHMFGGIDGEYFIEDLDRDDIALIPAGSWQAYHPDPRTVLNELVRRKALEPGDYLVDVFW